MNTIIELGIYICALGIGACGGVGAAHLIGAYRCTARQLLGALTVQVICIGVLTMLV